MTTASHNDANRVTRDVMKGKNTMSTNHRIVRGARKSPRTHAPVAVTIPSTMSETAFLIRFARKGACIVTDKNGNRRAEIGHAVNATIFAPKATTLRYAKLNRGIIGSTQNLGHSASDLLRGDISEA